MQRSAEVRGKQEVSHQRVGVGQLRWIFCYSGQKVEGT